MAAAPGVLVPPGTVGGGGVADAPVLVFGVGVFVGVLVGAGCVGEAPPPPWFVMGVLVAGGCVGVLVACGTGVFVGVRVGVLVAGGGFPAPPPPVPSLEVPKAVPQYQP